jgi:hypothetical protein
MKKIIFLLLAVTSISALFGQGEVKKNKWTFTNDVRVNGLLIVTRDSVVTRAPYHRDTILVNSGFTALDTTITTDTVVFHFPNGVIGSHVEIHSVSALTFVSFTNLSSPDTPPTSIAAGTTIEYIWSHTKLKWYRRR